jgi:hypothetical protein
MILMDYAHRSRLEILGRAGRTEAIAEAREARAAG